MFSSSSLQTCWLPRTIFFPQTFLHRTVSTKAIRNNISSHRSVTRFSFKIIRFISLKHRIKYDTFNTKILSMSTQASRPKIEFNREIHLLARRFLLSIEPDYRKILHEELIHVEKSMKPNRTTKIHSSQLALVFLETGLPFIGFGFVDNFVMLIAGDTIETFFGVAFCLSTMAAAGLGNAVSDVMGIGLADRIDRACGRILALFGIDLPKLTRAQWELKSVHVTQLLAKVVCIFFGCVLGMCPLLFRDTSAKKNQAVESNEE